MSQPFPIVHEQPLARTRSKLMLFARRDLSELPAQTPGTVLVFEVGGRYEVFHDRRHLTGREDAVVEAVTVSVVDVRERFVAVDLQIPSASPADDFRLRVTFCCKVTDPETVVRHGLSGLAQVLRDYLKRDKRLEGLGIQHQVDELNEVRGLVLAQVKAYCTVRPVRIDGMTVRLSTVEVSKPTGLVEHAVRLRDETWRQTYERLRRSYEDEEARRMADVLRSGAEAVEGLAMARGDITAGQAADRSYEQQELKDQRLHALVEMLHKDGHLDRLGAFDPDVLVQALADRVLPRQYDRPGLAARDHTESRPRLGRRPAPGDDLLLDEDELNDDH